MDVHKAIDERRAYRSLEAIEPTDALIDDLAGCARLAPSCYNNQPWRLVFVRDTKALESLRETLPEANSWAKTASLVVAVCAKKEDDCALKDGREYFLFDCGMAAAFMMLRATELGLVLHPIAGFKQAVAKKALGVPDEMTLITLAFVGKKTAQISPLLSDDMKKGEASRPLRKDLSEFRFIDSYPSGAV